jgi:hypothetical protein
MQGGGEMIDIPLGKALVPVEINTEYMKCVKCFYNQTWSCPLCLPDKRKDGKNVIFKLVDYPVEEKK